MKIALICDGPVPHERMNYRGEALVRLPQMGDHVISIVCPRSDLDLPVNGSIKLIRYPYGKYRFVRGFGSVPLRLWQLVLMYRRTRQALVSDIEVIRTISTLPTVIALLARGRRRVPIVANLSDFYSDLYIASKLPLSRLAVRLIWFLERVCAKADCLIVDTDIQRHRWVARGAPASHCVVIPHGLPRSWQPIPAVTSNVPAKKGSGSRLFYVGDISEMDGVDLLLHAMRELRIKGQQVDLVIVGAGTARYMRHLRRLSRSLDLEQAVVWIRSVPNRELPRLMETSDVCVAPFRLWETSSTSIPNKVLEYLTTLKPVVVPRGSALESIFGAAFIYFSAGDPQSLAAAVNQALTLAGTGEDPPLRRLIQKELHWQAIVDREWALIRAVANSSRQDLRAYDHRLDLRFDRLPRPRVLA